MKEQLRILVFPCGSEIGLELFRCLSSIKNIDLIGANSVDDHGKFFYKNYIGDLPFVDDKTFINKLNNIIKKEKIDLIFPATDSALLALSNNEKSLNCKLASSPAETVNMCNSKKKTYAFFKNHLSVPEIYRPSTIKKFPVFLKPDIGYGSRGVKMANTKSQVLNYMRETENGLILEYLSGKEYTVDCLTDKNGKLIYFLPRERVRVLNGISSNTQPVKKDLSEFRKIADTINSKLTFNGAWFFQVKRNSKGKLVLMEIACRIGGSSGLSRGMGVNLPLLTIYTHFNYDISIQKNQHSIEMDRALSNVYRIKLDFTHAYIDLDDTLIIREKLNTSLLKLIFQFINEKKKIILITKHRFDVTKTLEKFRISGIFDQIIHLKENENKSDFIKNVDSVFIDDSFSERMNVQKKNKIAVFGTENIDVLFNDFS